MGGVGHLPDDKVNAIANILLYADSDARRRLAEELSAGAESSTWEMLIATVRSGEPWAIRARCLELLGQIAGFAEQTVAEEILNLLGDFQENDQAK